MRNIERVDLRVHLRLNPTKAADVRWMKEVANVGTTADLYDNALTLLKWALQQRVAGREVASYEEAADRIRILLMPILEAAASHADQRAASVTSSPGGNGAGAPGAAGVTRAPGATRDTSAD